MKNSLTERIVFIKELLAEPEEEPVDAEEPAVDVNEPAAAGPEEEPLGRAAI